MIFLITNFENDIENRGVKNILILSSDELTGIQESIKAAFPKTDH